MTSLPTISTAQHSLTPQHPLLKGWTLPPQVAYGGINLNDEHHRPTVFLFYDTPIYAGICSTIYLFAHQQNWARHQWNNLGQPAQLLKQPFTVHGGHGELRLKYANLIVNYDSIKELKDYSLEGLERIV